MIDTARLAVLNAELAGVQDEEHILVRRRLAIVEEMTGLIRAGIQQPAPSVAGDGVAGLARASATPTQPPAGERRTGRDGHGVPASATTPPADVTVVICPTCDRAFAPHGLAVHRARAHKVAGATATTREKVQRTGQIPPAPMSEAKNGHPSRSEKFLCSRCSRSFLSRSARDQHETQVDCQPVPTRPPVSMRDAHETALADAGMLSGLGE